MSLVFCTIPWSVDLVFWRKRWTCHRGGATSLALERFGLHHSLFSQLTAFGRLTSKVVEEDEDPLFRTSSDPLGGQCHLGLIIHSSFCMVCVCVCVGCDDLTYIYIYYMGICPILCSLFWGADRSPVLKSACLPPSRHMHRGQIEARHIAKAKQLASSSRSCGAQRNS